MELDLLTYEKSPIALRSMHLLDMLRGGGEGEERSPVVISIPFDILTTIVSLYIDNTLNVAHCKVTKHIPKVFHEIMAVFSDLSNVAFCTVDHENGIIVAYKPMCPQWILCNIAEGEVIHTTLNHDNKAAKRIRLISMWSSTAEFIIQYEDDSSAEIWQCGLLSPIPCKQGKMSSSWGPGVIPRDAYLQSLTINDENYVMLITRSSVQVARLCNDKGLLDIVTIAANSDTSDDGEKPHFFPIRSSCCGPCYGQVTSDGVFKFMKLMNWRQPGVAASSTVIAQYKSKQSINASVTITSLGDGSDVLLNCTGKSVEFRQGAARVRELIFVAPRSVAVVGSKVIVLTDHGMHYIE